MRLITEIFSEKELPLLFKKGFKELILSPAELTIQGRLSLKTTKKILLHPLAKKIKFFIQADILIQENRFNSYLKTLFSLPLDQIEALRIKDLGLAHHLHEQRPDLQFHLILETGFSNLQALKSTMRVFKNSCSRVILPWELPLSSLFSWIPKIKKETEILILAMSFLRH